MSCILCPCQFSWPVDTLGNKRDPINCEKAWLDFAVRLLSREAVGKGRGQETVWSPRCKPHWWDSVMVHSWKNPTANPKDTKEILLDKFMALEKQLRVENRFPSELEEECSLWKQGKYRELFLLTSLTSLLGKVTNVHSAVEDACTKVKELKASVNQSILSNIQNCLKSSLKQTEELATKTSIRGRETSLVVKSRKRSLEKTDKENSECSAEKHCKVEDKISPKIATSMPCRLSSARLDQLEQTGQKSEDILHLAKKLLTKRRNNASKSQHSSQIPTTLKSPPQILPKPITSTSNSNAAQTQNTCNTTIHASPATCSPPTICVAITPQQFVELLSQNSVSTAEEPEGKQHQIQLQSSKNNESRQTLVSTSNGETLHISDSSFPGQDLAESFELPSSNAVDLWEYAMSPDKDIELQTKKSQNDCGKKESYPIPAAAEVDILDNLDDIEQFWNELLSDSNAEALGKDSVLNEPVEDLYLNSEDETVCLGSVLNSGNNHLQNPSEASAGERTTRISNGRACSTGSLDSSVEGGISESDIGYFSGDSPSSSETTKIDSDSLFLLQKFLFGPDSCLS